jgi:hypothetical protein
MLMSSIVRIGRLLDACDGKAFLPHDLLDVRAPVLEPPQIVGNQVIFSAAWKANVRGGRVHGGAEARTVTPNDNNTVLIRAPRKHFVISGAAHAAGESDRQARLGGACAHAVRAEIATRGMRERGQEAACEGRVGGGRRATIDMQPAQGCCGDTREVTRGAREEAGWHAGGGGGWGGGGGAVLKSFREAAAGTGPWSSCGGGGGGGSGRSAGERAHFSRPLPAC